jgi:hypothetical protein
VLAPALPLDPFPLSLNFFLLKLEMDQHLRRLLIIAILVSFLFYSSAQKPTSPEEVILKDDPFSLPSPEVCDPFTGECIEENKPNKAVTKEDTSDLEPSTVCISRSDPLDFHDEHISSSDTVEPLVESSAKEQACKSENSIISDATRKLCKCFTTYDVGCPDFKTNKFTEMKQKSFISRSGKAAQIEDGIQEEEQGISTSDVCIILPNGTEHCQEVEPPGRDFGISQPRVEAA